MGRLLRPEVADLAARAGRQPIGVQTAVVTGLGDPHERERAVVDGELHAGADDHADYPEV